MIDVIVENKEYIVVNKPADMPAQKDFSRTLDMLSVVEGYLGTKAFLIHRLDRHVAGPVVIAKTKTAAANLNKQLTSHGFSKIYKATVVHDKTINIKIGEEITLEHYHKKDKALAIIISKTEFMALSESEKKGFKPVKLKYTCLNTKTYDTMDLSILEIELFTGRFHQIRSQLKYVGLPILGDPKYGERLLDQKTYTKIGLQSTSLKFKDPKSNKPIRCDVEHYDGPFQLFKN